MEDLERIKERLENIRSVEPIIASLRTISAGGWQAALRGLEASKLYAECLASVLAATRPHISSHFQKQKALPRPLPSQRVPPRRVLMLVIAAERGLCGAFNDVVLEGADRLVEQQKTRSQQVFVATLGHRAQLHFEAQGRELQASYALPVTHIAPYELVRDIAESLIELVESDVVDAIQVIYSPYKAALVLAPVSRQWLPFSATDSAQAISGAPPTATSIIVETDPDQLYETTIVEWAYAQLYQFVIESAASEQAARFRAMEAASSNLSRKIDELTLAYHTARQHAITMQMLDLVAGAGILRKKPGTTQ